MAIMSSDSFLPVAIVIKELSGDNIWLVVSKDKDSSLINRQLKRKHAVKILLVRWNVSCKVIRLSFVLFSAFLEQNQPLPLS